MSDFVKRLRAASDDASLDCYTLCEEAADRIGALEAALRDIMMDVEIATPVREFARAALAPEQDR